MPRGAREAFVSVGIDQRQLDNNLRASNRKWTGWASKTGTDIGRAMRGGLGTLTAIGGLAGVAGMASAAKEVLEFETRLVRLQSAARTSTEKIALLKKQIFAVASARGLDPGDLLAGVELFVAKTGRFDQATDAMEGFSRVAQASGASLIEVNTAAAAMFTNMGVLGKEMESVFAGALVQGKEGSVEFKDMAAVLAELTPQFSMFRSGVGGMAEMGAVLQVVAKGFGSIQQASTGFSSLMTAYVNNVKDLKKAGVKVFQVDKKGVKTLRDFKDITFDLIAKTKGDPEKLQKLLGRAEAYKTIITLMKEGRGELERMEASVKGGAKEMAEDLARVEATPAAKIARAKADIKAIMNDSMAQWLPKVADAMAAIAKAIGFIADHPMESLAVLAALKGGGFIGGLGGALGAATGGGALMGAGGGAAGGAGARLLAGVGGALQGGAIGYGVSQTLGKDFNDISQATITAVHALAGLPGPIGMVGKAAAVAADGILLVYSSAIAKMEKREQEMVGRTLDQFFLKRGESLRDLDEGSIEGGFNIGAVGLNAQRRAGNITPQMREDARAVMAEAKTQGLLTQAGGRGGAVMMDLEKMRAFVNKQEGWTEKQKKDAMATFEGAHDVMSRDVETKAYVDTLINGPAGAGAPLTFGTDTAPWPEGGGMEEPHVFGGTTLPEQGAAPRQAYHAPRENRLLVEVELTIPEGLQANDPKIRRKGG